jgi:hypothetical protein
LKLGPTVKISAISISILLSTILLTYRHEELTVDEILNRDDTVLAEVFLNDCVVGQWDALLVDLVAVRHDDSQQ